MGPDLGHLHVGEMNRKPPQEGRMPWRGIAAALFDIRYDGHVVMEPFTQTGGQVGRDIKVWRDLSGGASREEMDNAVACSVRFLRGLFEK
jgi:D-psicose/D-tagatose/L-ribulose 3-epimerase